jgi:hypothetical protein
MSGVVVCFKIVSQHVFGGPEEFYKYFRITSHLAQVRTRYFLVQSSCGRHCTLTFGLIVKLVLQVRRENIVKDVAYE